MHKFICEDCKKESFGKQANKRFCGSQSEIGSCTWKRLIKKVTITNKERDQKNKQKRIANNKGMVLDMTACRSAFDWLQA